MIRREFFRNSLLVSAAALTSGQLSELSTSARATGEFPAAPGLTKYVSEFIANAKYEDIPESVVALGKKTLLDGFGLALAGSSRRWSADPAIYRVQGIAEGKASIIGTRLKAPPRFAALANGVSIHADDYDDTQLSIAPDRVYGATHPTVPVLPAVFAMSESARHTGKEIAAGLPRGRRSGNAKLPKPSRPGTTTTDFTVPAHGRFRCAAACAKLLRLDAGRTPRAGNRGGEGGGLRDNFGSMTKPYHAGHAAENGMVSAELAALGWTRLRSEILEAPSGWFHAAGGGYRSQRHSESSGQSVDIRESR